MSGSETGSEEIGVNQEGGGFHSGGGGGGSFVRPSEGNVATRAICIENKRFYIDVKENPRGRFIKISELSMEGRRNQILMTMSIASTFQKILQNMISEYSYFVPIDIERLNTGELSSDMIRSDEKVYRVDLKENVRGRFLKVSETFVRGKSRFQIAIPADGMVLFDEHLGDLIEEYGVPEEGAPPGESASSPHGSHQPPQQQPQQQHFSNSNNHNSTHRKLQVENKTYTFDCRKLPHGGRCISISETRGSFKSNIEIPESGWDSFRELFNEYAQECQEIPPH